MLFVIFLMLLSIVFFRWIKLNIIGLVQNSATDTQTTQGCRAVSALSSVRSGSPYTIQYCRRRRRRGIVTSLRVEDETTTIHGGAKHRRRRRVGLGRTSCLPSVVRRHAGRDWPASSGSERLISGSSRFAWFPVGRIMTPRLTDNDNRCPSTSRHCSQQRCTEYR